MRPTENLLIGLLSLLVVFLPAGAKHLSSPEKLRHVRAVEPSSSQQQQSQQNSQQQPSSSSSQSSSLYNNGRSGGGGDGTFLDDGMMTISSESRPSSSYPRFLSAFPTLEKLGYFLPPTTTSHDYYYSPLSSGYGGGRSASDRFNNYSPAGILGHARIGRADSNFIRFGRSSFLSSSLSGNSKKNNFIRLGRENPRQNNFIRLGRSGQWDSSERFGPKIGFFPDNYYYSTASHWARPTDLNSLGQQGQPQGIAAYDEALEAAAAAQDSGLFRQG